jgi:CheY-like chemotaxis protein
MRDKFVIVVADDDVDDQELMRKGLSDCRVTVEIVSVFNGLQLMDYLLRRESYKQVKDTPDLILLDLNMPLMDGFDVLKEIRKYNHLSKIPLYVITTSRAKQDKETALALGANGFYTKGTSSKDIRRIMTEICEECFQP